MSTQFIKFLENNEVGKDEPYTHTSLNKDTPAGKYFFSKKNLSKFFPLYFEHRFIQNKDIHLIEKHPANYSKMCIDIDLKYSSDTTERQYTQDDIELIVKTYIAVIKDICKTIPDGRLLAHIFEKDDIQIKGSEVKDGIHIMFPFLPINYQIQYIIRDMVINRLQEETIFESCESPLDKIIDKAVIEKNGWLLYGSAKKDGVPYKLTHIYDADLEEIELPEIDCNFVKLLSIMDNGEEIVINMDKFKDFDKKKKQLEKIEEAFSENNPKKQVGGKYKPSDEFVTEIMKLVGAEKCDTYETWFSVGAGLYNTDTEYLELWKAWSSQSAKYSEKKCEDLWEKTFPNYNGPNPTTFRTIRKYARLDNEQQYLQVVDKYNEKDEFSNLLREGLCNTHYDFAKMIHYIYEGEFVFSENEWFVYESNKWKKVKETPIQLRKKISNDIIKRFLAYNAYLTNKAYKASEEDNEKQRDLFIELGEQCRKVIRNLKNSITKTNVINECKELFYDEEFKDKLDTDIYLLGFDNGVVDLRSGEFRRGLPQDKVSYSCGYEFTNKVDPVIRKEIMDNLIKIQPDKEIRDFLLTYYASTLVGTNKNEVFLNLEGSGGNGKGMISTLHSSALGDYAGTLNNNYLVNTFNSPESHNTMLANNYKKRYLQVNEPANTKNLNINLIKEMTGGDDIQLRIAHSAETKTVEPLFKLCMLFNEIPRIENTKDGGFIRRFIGINFPNRFVDREPKNLNEFRKDPNLKQKIKNNKEWHQQYMLILLDYLKKYIENNERLEVPERIKKNSQRLLGDQDPYTDFIASCVTITNVPTDYTRRDDMWDAFKKYYRENYPDKLRISSKMFADKMKQSFPDEVQFKVRMTIQVETGKKLVGNVFTGVKLNEDEQPTFSQYDF